MNWAILLMAILYFLLGFGVASGIYSAKGKMGYFEILLVIAFWPVVLMGLIVFRLIK